jgi:hypothetical protein
MSRPFAKQRPSRPRRTRIEGVRLPAGLRHLLGGGGEYDYAEPRCHTCMSDDRETIENMVLANLKPQYRHTFAASLTHSAHSGQRLTGSPSGAV